MRIGTDYSFSIPTPFGTLLTPAPTDQLELPFKPDEVHLSPPTVGNEIHAPITSKLNYSTLRTGSWDKARETIRRAASRRAACVTVPPEWIKQTREYLGEGSPMRVNVVCGLGKNNQLVSSEEIRKQVRQAVAFGCEEISFIPNYGALKAGNVDAFKKDLQETMKVARKGLVKVILDPAILNSDELGRAAKLAEEAGARFVRVGSHSDAFDVIKAAEIVRDNCSLGVEFARNVGQLGTCQKLAELMGPKRRVRFEARQAQDIANQEIRYLQNQQPEEQKKLSQEMLAADGLDAMKEREKLMAYFQAKIDKAHAEGKPVIYLSVPVRANDAAGFDQNVAEGRALVQQAEKAGVAYIDPFEVEGTSILTHRGISSKGIQELLMDPMTGLWPRVLFQCDGIAHAKNWKFSTGAREEDMLAQAWNIPTWDGKNAVPVKPQEDVMAPLRFLQDERVYHHVARRFAD